MDTTRFYYTNHTANILGNYDVLLVLLQQQQVKSNYFSPCR